MPSRSRRLAACLALVVGAGALSSIAPVAAAPDDQAFAPLRGFEPSGAKVRVEPKEYAATRVDLGALRGELPQAGGSAVVEIPGPDGRPQSFRVERTQRMESELAAAHPEIATWSGVGVDDPRVHHRPRHHADGLPRLRAHARRPERLVRRPGLQPPRHHRAPQLPLGRPAGAGGAPRRRVRSRRSARRSPRPPPTARRSPARRSQRHYYRLALTSDPSYAAYFGTANVLAEKVTLINRVNQIYNDDLATELRLVNDTDKLNLDTDAKATGADGPCGAAPCFEPYDDNGTPDDHRTTPAGDLDFCDVPTLGKNRTVLGQLIGASNYDVGHIALGNNGGGIAYLGVVGGDYKGGGCTGLPEPKGDFFAIDYVAHEIGHQFAGNHTFNGAARRLRRQHLRGLGRAGLRLLGDGLRRHLRPGRPAAAHRPLLLVPHHRRGRRLPRGHLRQHRGADGLAARLRRPGDTPRAGVRRQHHRPDRRSPTTPPPARGGHRGASPASAVSIAQWGFDEFNSTTVDYVPAVEPDETGFQVIFNDEPRSSPVAGDVRRRTSTELTVEPGRRRAASSARPRAADRPRTTASSCGRTTQASPTTPRRSSRRRRTRPSRSVRRSR